LFSLHNENACSPFTDMILLRNENGAGRMTEQQQPPEKKRGRPAKGDRAMTNAERQAQHRAKAKERAQAAIPIADKEQELALQLYAIRWKLEFIENQNQVVEDYLHKQGAMHVREKVIWTRRDCRNALEFLDRVVAL